MHHCMILKSKHNNYVRQQVCTKLSCFLAFRACTMIILKSFYNLMSLQKKIRFKKIHCSNPVYPYIEI